MWNLFYRNTRLLILTVCLILVWGISSFQVLPRMEDPELSQRFALVRTFFPGASAERVESLVTEKIEEKLSEISELKAINSTSRLGSSSISLELEDEVTNVDDAWSRIRDKLEEVNPILPEGATEPEYTEIDSKAYTKLVALTWNLEGKVNYTILGRLGKKLEDKLRGINGTEKVELFGAPEEEIIVDINSSKLAALGLTLQNVSQQIEMSDAKVSAGQLRGNDNDLLIEVKTELDSLERIRDIPIRCDRCGNSQDNSGTFTRLGDLAFIDKGIKEPPLEQAIINGKPGVVVGALMESTQRIDLWTAKTDASLEEFKTRLSDGIRLDVIFNQKNYVERTLNHLSQNLLLGVICVFITTVVLMGWKSALVVGSSLPLSVLMVLGGMNLTGVPLHQVSITGLVIALGLLIDNAVVVVDEVERRLKQGMKAIDAVTKSVRSLAIPLLASTLTTVLTFMPIIVLPGSPGEFVRGIAVSVILSLFSSLFLALTVIPAIAGKLHVKGDREREQQQQWSYVNSVSTNRSWRSFWNNGFSSPQLTLIYRRILDRILARPVLGVVIALILPLSGLLMATTLERQFFPAAERDQFYVELELPSQSSLKQTESLTMEARQIILEHPEVEETQWFLGKNGLAFYYNLPRSRKNSPNYAQGLIQLHSGFASDKLIQSLQKELNLAFPSTRVLVRQLEQGSVISAPIAVRIFGDDLDVLRELGKQLQAELTTVNNVIYTRANLTETVPKIALQVDEEQARLAGLDNTLIAQQLEAKLEGSLGGSILEGTEELPVRVRISDAKRSDLDKIVSLDLLSETISTQESVPSVSLSALGKIELIPEEATIVKRNGKRVNTVQAFVTAGVLPSTALDDFRKQLKTSDFQLPPGYSIEFGGENAARNEAIEHLMSTLGILVATMLAILVLSFGSFRAAAIITIVAWCSVGLGLFSLWIFGYPFGFMAILGTVGLVGIAINDSIVVLSALRSHPLARIGNLRAIRETIVHSTRHVITTTLTTVAGFIPLWIDGGQSWPPLAVCIAGGVIGATLLALFLVPCLHLLLLKRNS
nr:efflux RND transporter permease subunit [Prochloraceae cyanobacterium]